jgi:hypothetical protein
MDLIKELESPFPIIDFSQLDKACWLEYGELSNNHPIKVTVTPVPDHDGELKQVDMTNNGIIVSDGSIIGRGVNIQIIFMSEHNGFWVMEIYFDKGNSCLKTRKLDENSPELSGFKPTTIWRD